MLYAILLFFAIVGLLGNLFILYCCFLAGKQADEEMFLLMDENIEKRNRKIMEEREVESQREELRMSETEIKKGSAQVEFMGIDFPEDAYHMVESQIISHCRFWRASKRRNIYLFVCFIRVTDVFYCFINGCFDTMDFCNCHI